MCLCAARQTRHAARSTYIGPTMVLVVVARGPAATRTSLDDVLWPSEVGVTVGVNLDNGIVHQRVNHEIAPGSEKALLEKQI